MLKPKLEAAILHSICVTVGFERADGLGFLVSGSMVSGLLVLGFSV